MVTLQPAVARREYGTKNVGRRVRLYIALSQKVWVVTPACYAPGYAPISNGEDAGLAICGLEMRQDKCSRRGASI